MSETFKFWTHGVSVVPEYTKEYTGTDNGLYLRRTGFGSIVRQNLGTGNWFHFAIPSATRLDDDASKHYLAWLRFRINTDAVIKQIHVRGNQRNSESPIIWQSGSISITGQDTQYDIDLRKQGSGSFAARVSNFSYGPVVISVNVYFEGAKGEVLFTGAGVHFEEM